MPPGPARGPTGPGHTAAVRIRIEGRALPGRFWGPTPERPGGFDGIEVGVQRRGRPDEHLDLVPGDAPSASWTIDADVVSTPVGPDLKGPYIQGPPGGRFIYLSWGTVADTGTFTMFRRAKLMLEAVPAGVEQASATGTLVGRLGLTDPSGGPICAAVRPPVIEWSAQNA